MKKHFLTVKRSLAIAVASLMLLAAQNANAYTYTALDGVGAQYGGSGYWALVDSKVSTKSINEFKNGSLDYFVIFKADQAIVPTNYFLVMGDDTGGLPDRNWKSWQIYGANFASDADATRDATDWVLVDNKVNYELPAVNGGTADLVCSENNTTAYQYFMINVSETVNVTDLVQMAEFGWGTYEQFYNSAPLDYLLLRGDNRKGSQNGSADCLFDGKYNTKLCVAFYPGNPLHEIFKTNRPIAPTWYCLVTGDDTGYYPERNWKAWQIYGGNFESDDDAVRDAEGWVLIDERIDCTDLPAANCAETYFDLNQGVTEKFQYFKLEINRCMVDRTVDMQMAEMFIGDADLFQNEVTRHYDLAKVEIDKPCVKSILDEYKAALENIKTATNMAELMELYEEALALKADVNASVIAFEDYQRIVDKLRDKLANGKIADEGVAIIEAYLNTNAAPSGTYSNGTYMYIMENQQLDMDGIHTESIFVNQLLELYATDLTDGAIDVTYTVIGGDFTSAASMPFALLDGNDDTKWCLDTPGHRIVFKTSEPIAPTYYRLFTGDDTGILPERNWVTWKVYAANFSNDEEWEEMVNWDGWTVIDDKQNIGPDLIPAASKAACYLYLSNPSETEYQYFMINIEAPTGCIQMGEFTFGNDANVVLTRREYISKFQEQGFDDKEFYNGYAEQYNVLVKNLMNAPTLTEMGRYYTELNNMIPVINASIDYYTQYSNAIAELDSYLSLMPTSMSEFWTAYIYEYEEPGDVYTNGSYTYIVENFTLDNDAIQKEIEKVNAVIKSILDGSFIPVNGTNTYGPNSGFAKLLDRDSATKWCEFVKNGAHVIFKTMNPAQPLFYKLTTGDDSGACPERNWQDWQVYGGNFANDEEASRDAEGWVLIDDHKGVKEDRLPLANFATAPFGFTEGVEEEYQYYMIVVSQARNDLNYTGNDFGFIQMAEFEFGTEEEFEEYRQIYTDSIAKFDIESFSPSEEVLAQFDEYESIVNETYDMEELVESFNSIVALVDRAKMRPYDFILLSGANSYAPNAGCAKLVDRDRTTKWAEFIKNDPHVIVKTQAPVQPKFYTLVTGDDTGSNGPRNWQNWQVYGANFASDEEATRNAEGWVLIDDHKGVKEDRLPIADFTPASFGFSEGFNEPYQYYMIVVTEARTDLNYRMSDVGFIQMSEFEFGGEEEFEAVRQEYIDSIANINVEGIEAQAELNKLYEGYKATINSSNDMEELSQSFADIQAVAFELQNVGKDYVILSGTHAYRESVNYDKLIDQDLTTKWYGIVPKNGPAGIVFMMSEATEPLFYQLTPGDDTSSCPERNWKSWKIYGGNFTTVNKATRDAEGWVLLDERKDVGQDRLPAVDAIAVPFGFTEDVKEGYKYFKIEISASYKGGEIQMLEFGFGSDEEFEAIRQEYVDSLATYDFTGVKADVALNERYEAYKATIESTNNLEELFDSFAAIVALINEVGNGIADINLDCEQAPAIYDLMGRRIAQPTEKGIYIQNGKKFMIK